MRRSLPIFTLATAFLVCIPALLPAQQDGGGETVGVPWTGKPGIVVTVKQLMDLERQQPPVPPGTVRAVEEEFDLQEMLPPRTQNPESPDASSWPPASKGGLKRDNTRVQGVPNQTQSPQTIGANFFGTNIGASGGWLPPDTQGDVGPTQIVMVVNNHIVTFDKAGNPGPLNTSLDVLFSAVRSGNAFDPRVRYDRISGRWFVTSLDFGTPNRILIAVSSGSSITGTGSFTVYAFQHDLVGPTPNSDTGGFADYETLGVDANALYIGINVFNAAGTAYLGSTGFVVNKANILSGTLTVTAFRQICTSAGVGLATPYGVQDDDPSWTEGYFIGTSGNSYGVVVLRRVSNPGGVPSISGNLNVTVPATSNPIAQVQSGGNPLDGLDDRFYSAMMRKNKNTGATTLWTAHANQVNTSGVSVFSGGRNGMRWYEFDNLTTTPTLRQAGTLYDPAGTFGYWMGSTTMSGQGHMALGSSMSSASSFTAIAAAGRFAGDGPGTIQSPTVALTSPGPYQLQGGTQRWGDYSQTVVDPNDDMTMWTFQEYADATNSWAVRAIQLIAPPPATPSACAPPGVTTGQASVLVTVTGTQISGSGFFDPGPGYANHLSASVTGGVTVNSATYVNPTTLTLDLNTTAATAGTWDVTVTNPDGQSRTGIGILSVTAPGACTLTCPSNITTGNNGGQCGATVNYPAPTTSGTCGTVTCSPASGSFFAAGVTTVTCSETGGATCAFTITVIDTQPPTITCPANITTGTAANQCGATVTYATPTASDNCPGLGPVTCAPASGTFFPKGTTAVTCNVVDASLNAAACTFTVTVNDTQNPSITCPSNITTGTAPNQCGATVTYPAPTFSDNCPGVSASCTPASGSFFSTGTTTVTCTATDASARTATCTFAVTVLDSQPPSISCPAPLVRPTDPGVCTAVVTYAPTISDNCAGASASCVPPSGSTFPKGTSPVTCTAKDAANNTATCAFTVTVNDTEAPQLTVPGSITLNADAGVCGKYAAGFSLGTAAASDNCPGVTLGNNAPGLFPIGTTTVTWTAKDASGNLRTGAQNVTIVDNQPPNVYVYLSPTTLIPANQTMRSVTAYVTVSDNCAAGTGFTLYSVTSSDPDAGLFNGDLPNDIQGASLNTPDTQFSLRAERRWYTSRSYVVRYRGTDGSGNASIATRIVVVPVTPKEGETPLPSGVTLEQNYPNPFNPTTTITYGLPEECLARVTVYDALARTVAILAEGVQPAGMYSVVFDASSLPSGMYVCVLEANGEVLKRTMSLLK